ncbi:hypothetical protein BDF20DRAFT_816653 [Mycotypha africana]|uniref:uncharacterized protein n=1 Tax=Mycotypha africana TaxID=64632 RepID=UPI002300FB35|nr:uncharacterized protein BDF20DRAFT_816653 [Mycotypha africana]KAI8984364.1 hypothetical protein BDF20DRAFT_816653 [Mycotypha africana]
MCCTLALANVTIAAPIQDLSVTSVDLAENTLNANGDERLFVTVTRIDDLVDDDGSLLAERIMAVKVTFDVVDNQLMCNGQPFDIGVSNIEVEAQVASNPDKLVINSEEDAAILADSFDTGLVTVEVTASVLDELKTDDGMTFRRINVKEVITEVNGLKVVQTEAGQQILDVFDNGDFIKWSIDPLTGFMLPGPAIVEADNAFSVVDCPSCHSFDLRNWWNENTTGMEGLIGGIIFAFVLCMCLAIRYLITSAAVETYEQIPAVQREDEEKEQPPAYAEKEEGGQQPLLSEEKAFQK